MTYRRIVVLTGAGISAESGLKTFRDSDGLWEQHRIEDVATPEGFARDPALVHRFYNARRQQLLSDAVQPNAAHRALATLEQAHLGTVLVVTQNVDDLHEGAGSRCVIHLHGELRQIRCCQSGQVWRTEQDTSVEDQCRCCHPARAVRPHVVWFGETPLELDRIAEALGQCDLFFAIGTSGHVYPAAGFVQTARAAGAHTVELNLEPSAVQSAFDECRYGPAGELVPAYVEELLVRA